MVSLARNISLISISTFIRWKNGENLKKREISPNFRELWDLFSRDLGRNWCFSYILNKTFLLYHQKPQFKVVDLIF